MLFRRKPREVEELPVGDEAVAPIDGQTAALRDELGLHRLWYLELRLREELARAARTGSIFSLAAWQPRLLPGDTLAINVLRQVAGLIAGGLRFYDLVARVDDHRFVALLLDADYPGACTVTYRIKADIQRRIQAAGRWRAGVATFGIDGVDGNALIHTAFRRLEEQALAA